MSATCCPGPAEHLLEVICRRWSRCEEQVAEVGDEETIAWPEKTTLSRLAHVGQQLAIFLLLPVIFLLSQASWNFPSVFRQAEVRSLSYILRGGLIPLR